MFREQDIVRFWSKVDIKSSDECWPWLAATDHHGYGQFKLDHHMVRAHRFAYMTANGSIPDELLACHRCNYPPCCNPAHIYAGSVADNVHDSMRAGTHSKPPIHLQMGSLNNAAKLDEASVRLIRSLYGVGGISQSQLGRCFNVTQTAILKIVRRQRWNHVN